MGSISETTTRAPDHDHLSVQQSLADTAPYVDAHGGGVERVADAHATAVWQQDGSLACSDRQAGLAPSRRVQVQFICTSGGQDTMHSLTRTNSHPQLTTFLTAIKLPAARMAEASQVEHQAQGKAAPAAFMAWAQPLPTSP